MEEEWTAKIYLLYIAKSSRGESLISICSQKGVGNLKSSAEGSH